MADFLILASSATTASAADHPAETVKTGTVAASTATHGVTDTHATTVAHGGGEAHAEPTALMLGATAWVSLAMLVLVLVLIAKKAPAAIGKMLDGRIAMIRQQLDEAAALRGEAETLRDEYRGKLSALDAETAAIRSRAEEEAKHLVAQSKADAEDLVARRQRMAEDRIGAAERAALADVREKASQAAAAAAATLIAAKHDAGTDKTLVDATIADLTKR